MVRGGDQNVGEVEARKLSFCIRDRGDSGASGAGLADLAPPFATGVFACTVYKEVKGILLYF